MQPKPHKLRLVVLREALVVEMSAKREVQLPQFYLVWD